MPSVNDPASAHARQAFLGGLAIAIGITRQMIVNDDLGVEKR